MEIWRDIPGYIGFYQVSDFGRVRSLPRVILRRNGNSLPIAARVLKPSLGNHGYLVVNLSRDGEISQKTVHTLVAEAFYGPCPHGQEVLHRDGVRINCEKANLRYGTRKENVADAQTHGTHVRGEKVGNSKLTASDVLEIKARLKTGEMVTNIAREFGVSHAAIIGIRKGRNWSWIKEPA